MRLLLDTNVVFSALLWQGSSHRLLQTIRANPDIQLFSSLALIEELADVLTRKESAKRLKLLNRSIDSILADYVMAVNLVEPVQIPPTSIDPDDDIVLATALAARADAIISGDIKHLVALRHFQDIPILATAEAITMIQRSEAV